MITIFKKLLQPVFEARLARARLRYQASPDAAGTASLACALLRAGHANESYSIIVAARRAFPRDTAIRRAHESIRKGFARLLLAKALPGLKKDARVEAYLRAADLLRTLGKSAKALALLERAREACPDHWGVEYSAGQVHFHRYRRTSRPRDIGDCLSSLRRARELNPDNLKVLFALALALAQAGDHGEALSIVESILELTPADPRTLALRAHIERALAGAAAREAAEDEAAAQPEVIEPAGDESMERFIEKAGVLPGTLGVFAVSADGALLGSLARGSELFALEDAAEAVAAMALIAKSDAARIGVGALESCVLTGDEWQVVIRTVEDVSLVAFLEGPARAPAFASLADQLLVQAS